MDLLFLLLFHPGKDYMFFEWNLLDKTGCLIQMLCFFFFLLHVFVLMFTTDLLGLYAYYKWVYTLGCYLLMLLHWFLGSLGVVSVFLEVRVLVVNSLRIEMSVVSINLVPLSKSWFILLLTTSAARNMNSFCLCV